MPYEVALADGFTVSDSRERLDIDEVYRFISEESYWGKGRPRAVFARALEHSMAFGLYTGEGRQIGFARVVTDRAIRAHLNDVYVLSTYRGRGLGKGLVGAVLDHPELATVGTWSLNTDDAHGLYASFGFGGLRRPESFMMRVRGASPAETD
jgi:GNAT superfamily N-acetyltransferase